MLAGFVASAREIAGAAEAEQSGPVEEVALDGWSRSHIVLLGDAALREYEDRRPPWVEWAQQQTRKRDRPRAMAPVLRDVVLGAVGDRMFRATFRQLIPAP